jgi:hypothetical protein
MTPRRFDPKNVVGHYVLMGKLAVPEPDLFKWAEWFEKSAADDSRRVAHTQVGGISISTVFLGLDHSFDYSGKAIPILFETMAFGGGSSRDLDCERCETWEQAEKQHADMVAKFRAAIKDKVND